MSPLRRTLKTAYFLFKDHKDFKNIKFIVLPLIRERLSAPSNIPGVRQDIIEEFKEKFEHFDTSFVDTDETNFLIESSFPRKLYQPKTYSFQRISRFTVKIIQRNLRFPCAKDKR